MENHPIKTTKLRALRVPLDFDSAVDGAWKWKIMLSALAALVAVFYGWYVLYADQGGKHAAPGPVANVHVMWESQCFACHVDDGWLGRHPMRQDAWSAEQTSVKFTREIDLKCRQCHDGPEHHVTEQPADVASCATCHAEHRGRGALLSRVDDRHCLVCHDDLAEHLGTAAGFDLDDPANWRLEPITGFHKRHPDFSSIQQDPGTIKFNHKLHMSLGLSTPEHGSQPWTWDRLSADDRLRYREILEETHVTTGDQGENDYDKSKVRLTCWACHQLDGTDAGIGGLVGATNVESVRLGSLPAATPARAAGSYMLPIRYEKDCQACHPLYFDPTQPEQVVPHRASPEEIREFLVSTFVQRYLRSEAGEPTTAESQSTKLEVGGRWEMLKYLPQKPGLTAMADDIEKMLIGVAKAELEIRNRCVKCHEFQEKTKRDEVELLRELKQSIWSALLPNVRPANVPEVWLQHARFDHAAHRAVDCLECHRRASDDQDDASRTCHDVLIPSRENCQQCHRPLEVDSGVRQVGARFDCVECHRYHGGDHPLHGVGARRRGPMAKKSMADFRQGTSE